MGLASLLYSYLCEDPQALLLNAWTQPSADFNPPRHTQSEHLRFPVREEGACRNPRNTHTHTHTTFTVRFTDSVPHKDRNITHAHTQSCFVLDAFLNVQTVSVLLSGNNLKTFT